MSFPRYPEVKDSGVEWLGEVPAHWESRRLKDGGSLVAGSAFPHDNQEQQGLEFPFYKVGDLVLSSDGRTMGHPQHTISRQEAFTLRARIIPRGAVVWAKIGAALMLNRRRLVNVPCCIDNNMTAYIPDLDRLSPLWAYYWTSQLDFTQFANPGAVPSLGEGYQKTLPLLLPPSQEQVMIASFLDHETARIDALVEQQQRLIELLKEKRQAVISHAVTKGLDPDVPMKDSGVEWLGEVPAHWDVMKFVRCVRIAEGQVDPKLDEYRQRVLIAPNHIESSTGKIICFETAGEQGAESGKYVCQPGDVVYSKIRPALRKACILNQSALCSADMYPLRPFGGLSSQFLLWSILSEPFSRLAVLESERVAMPKINRESLNEIYMAIPPAYEQEKIGRYISEEIRRLDQLTSIAEDSVGLLAERRSALISAAVTGKIDVRDWQPPAGSPAPTEATQTEAV